MTKAAAKNIDFSGVKDRGAFNPHRIAEGDYAATISKVEDGKAKESGNAMYVFTIKLEKFSQYSYPYRCVITENQLWKLRNIAVAAGKNVPKKRVKFDPNTLVGKKIGVTIEDDEYDKDGKTIEKSEVSSVFPVSELAEGSMVDDTDDFDDDSAVPVDATDEPEDEADSEEEKPKKKKDKKAKAEEPAAEEPKKKKKDKKKKGADGEVEELDISDIG